MCQNLVRKKFRCFISIFFKFVSLIFRLCFVVLFFLFFLIDEISLQSGFCIVFLKEFPQNRANTPKQSIEFPFIDLFFDFLLCFFSSLLAYLVINLNHRSIFLRVYLRKENYVWLFVLFFISLLLFICHPNTFNIDIYCRNKNKKYK